MDNSILQGVRVLDLTQYYLGPHTTLLLAGLGAEVIRVDNPETGDTLSGSAIFLGRDGPSLERRDEDDIGIPLLKRGRGKKAITLNLKADEGQRLFLELVDKADVVVENFSVGVAARLGIDFETLHARNPKLVYASLTGYGQTGPDAGLKCFDPAAQAVSGLMAITGHPDGPPTKAGSGLADSITSVYAFSGILAALFHAERTGQGQHVDVAMVDSVFSLVYDEPLECYAELGLSDRQGNRVSRVSPFNAYRSADGWLIIGLVSDAHWRLLCSVIEQPELADDSDFATASARLINNTRVDEILSAWTADRGTEQAVGAVQAAGLVGAAVNNIAAIRKSPQFKARGMIEDVVHPTLGVVPGVGAAGFPIKFSVSKTGYDTPAVLPGSHNAEIYGSLLDLDEAELARLTEAGVI
ncbi:MAG: CoA transferase [Alphaproteobacteria bacterium]|jgi:formyl-CoA transferase|nr:CoA transferase [Alphaproteobacteria bacterium]MDP7055503.1 CoA transferase [Alphaproteobacteria bacterium]MDP7462620.1 CoA transferase [Alphaproteobacteria bacterium]HJM92395.1 CoA transferase [Alphaproteobacteria bacterium]|tara:strand:+ start:3092 stop:4327 length:1236 start_codon:yes stop_codon:yes gene_type:complete